MDVPLEDQALTDQALTSELLTWAGRAAAAQARLVALIGEFDAREAWAGAGVLSCAHWLSWQLGMGLVAARERVRVARVLRLLPVTQEAFAAGRLSWSQVRALTRCATSDTEAELVELARGCTGAQLERLVRGLRRLVSNDQRERDPQVAEQALRCRSRYDGDGTLVLTLRVAPEQAQVVLAGLDLLREQVQGERDRAKAALTEELTDELTDEPDASAEAPEPPAPPVPLGLTAPTARDRAAGQRWRAECRLREAMYAEARRRSLNVLPATLGDALVRMSELLTSTDALRTKASARLRFHLDPRSGWVRTSDDELLPPAVVQRLISSPARSPQTDPTLRPLTSQDLTRHDLGRTDRLVSGLLRMLLSQVDGERCRFPSCTRTTGLHAHHVRFWRDGGPTDLANLVLVCARHHTLIHQYGFQLVLSPDRTLTVRTHDDIPVPTQPTRQATPTHDWTSSLAIDDTTLPPTWLGDPLNLHYLISTLAPRILAASAEAPAAERPAAC